MSIVRGCPRLPPAGCGARQGGGQHPLLHGRRLARPQPGRQGPVGARAGDGHVSGGGAWCCRGLLELHTGRHAPTGEARAAACVPQQLGPACATPCYAACPSLALARPVPAPRSRIRGLGMEVCTTLGMLSPEQAQQLRQAGLTAYNHNLDTSPGGAPPPPPASAVAHRCLCSTRARTCLSCSAPCLSSPAAAPGPQSTTRR